MVKGWEYYIILTIGTMNIVTISQTTAINCTYTTQLGRNIETVDCTNVGLNNLHAGQYPVNYTTLDHLDLKNNTLTVLEPNVFDVITSLKFLDLSNNLLQTLHHQLFSKLKNLSFLFVFNNKLTTLSDSRLFSSQSSLVKLHLSFNKLTFVNVSVLEPLVSIKVLALNGNPLLCNAQLRPAVLWCEEKNLKTDAVCQNPLNLTGQSWTVLNTLKTNSWTDLNSPDGTLWTSSPSSPSSSQIGVTNSTTSSGQFSLGSTGKQHSVLWIAIWIVYSNY